MITNKKNIVVSVLLLFSQVIFAQENYGFYLQKARQRLAEGDCARAEASYNVYLFINSQKGIEK